ncbi:hypothetical protein Aple_035030 [Acrocarpospora pleiomorpha]|uniref:Uncharacterized protein n=1 Tax=Acrocarpospora pleiomorpha TaxID=90975 RepID=A0A5M3XGA9_9ACTN|nr:hypothetical protein Aple_035030 [Acrocarpospora pleiomorpha]
MAGSRKGTATIAALLAQDGPPAIQIGASQHNPAAYAAPRRLTAPAANRKRAVTTVTATGYRVSGSTSASTATVAKPYPTAVSGTAKDVTRTAPILSRWWGSAIAAST